MLGLGLDHFILNDNLGIRTFGIRVGDDRLGLGGFGLRLDVQAVWGVKERRKVGLAGRVE